MFLSLRKPGLACSRGLLIGSLPFFVSILFWFCRGCGGREKEGVLRSHVCPLLAAELKAGDNPLPSCGSNSDTPLLAQGAEDG